MHKKLLLTGIVLLSAVLALGAIACGDDDDDGDGNGAVATATEVMVDEPTATGPAPTEEPVGEPTDDGSASSATVIATDNADLGLILTDLEGNTLYVFANDEPGVSNCTDTCTDLWPPLTVLPTDNPLTDDDLVTGALTTIDRGDGTFHVTYDGAPLYYFANDEAPGDTNGDGFGGLWSVVQLG